MNEYGDADRREERVTQLGEREGKGREGLGKGSLERS